MIGKTLISLATLTTGLVTGITTVAIPPLQLAQAHVRANETSHTLFLYDFYADWCGNCKKIEPMLKSLEQKYRGSVEFVHIDIEAPENRQIVENAGIESVPTLYIIDNQGNPRAVFVGAGEAQQIDGALAKELSQQGASHL